MGFVALGASAPLTISADKAAGLTIGAAHVHHPSVVIQAAVGRSLWYRPSSCDLTGPLPMVIQAGEAPGEGAKPLHATILAVWDDGTVNVQVLDIIGHAFTKKRVKLRQPAESAPAGGYCEWPTAVAMAARGVR